MRVLFYLHHPSQFHMFSQVMHSLSERHEIKILATKKDVLEDLLKAAGFAYTNVLPHGRRDNKLSIALGLLKQDFRLYKICRVFRPDLLVGTSTEIAHIGKLLSIPSFFFVEDDAAVIPLAAWLAYPFASKIVSPVGCDNGRWNPKTIRYAGYQKLAYLHPDNFKASEEIAFRYLKRGARNYLIRLAKLTAHHDAHATGIDAAMLRRIISVLSGKGAVHISAEGILPLEFKRHQVVVKPEDMHHVLAFSDIYIGDSQSMALEAALLAVPGIRISGFAGRISVLEELEKKYDLASAFNPSMQDDIFGTIDVLTSDGQIKEKYLARRARMLNEKINVSAFFVHLIENYKSYLFAGNSGGTGPKLS